MEPKQKSKKLTTGINLFNKLDLQGDALVVEGLEQQTFSIPFNKIKNSAIYNSNEIELDIPLEEHNENHDILCEARFFIPIVTDPGAMEEEEQPKQEGEEANKENEETQNTPKEPVLTYAEEVHKIIRKKAKIDENMGELIARIENLSLTVPRGKYTVDLHLKNMRLHGSTFNYKILYKNIVKAFLLPRNDDIHTNLVLGFNKPLRQGNTKYPYIIFSFKRNKQISVELKVAEDKLAEINPGLKPTYEGACFEVVAMLFKLIINVNIIIPGAFKTQNGHSSVKCNVGNQEGYLFFLNKSLIFIKKPVIYIRLQDVLRIEFQRISGGISMRGFDFVVILKSGLSTTFSGTDKRELENISNFFERAKIPVKTINEMSKLDAELGFDDDDDDADLVKDEDLLDDEDDEVDEDFVAPDDDGLDDEDEDYKLED